MTSDIIAQYYHRSTQKETTSQRCPMEHNTCDILIVIADQLSDFWNSDQNYENQGNVTKICIGENATPFNIIIDQCLYGMRNGEVCEVLIKADGSKFKKGSEPEDQMAKEHRRDGDITRGIPDMSEVIHISLTLERIQDGGKDICHLSPEEKFKFAKELKISGAELYKSHFKFSFVLFSRSLKYLISMGTDIPDDICEDVNLLKVQCYSNLSACQLQTGAYTSVIHNCSRCLEFDPVNMKALYRMGQSHIKLGNLQAAESDLQKAITIEPSNRAIQNLLQSTQEKLQKQNQSLASAMSKMFN